MNDELRIKNGFSLLELLIYIAILSVMTIFIAGIFISINRGGGAIEARNAVNSDIRFAVEKISQDLRSATSSSAITNPASTSTPSAILALVVGADTISYATTTTGQLQRTINGISQTITSDVVKVVSLNFTRLENQNAVLGKIFVAVKVKIGASYNSESPDWQYSENKETTIGIRN